MNIKYKAKVVLTEENGREWTGEIDSNQIEGISKNNGVSYEWIVGDTFKSLLKACNEYRKACEEHAKTI
jgi:hypothetical protein